MNDQVARAIARTLRVPQRDVTLWRIQVGTANAQRIEAELEVRLHMSDKCHERLQAQFNSELRSSMPIKRVSPVVMLGERLVFVEIVLCHGKETQHIFKALHQLMTVRGNQKARKK